MAGTLVRAFPRTVTFSRVTSRAISVLLAVVMKTFLRGFAGA